MDPNGTMNTRDRGSTCSRTSRTNPTCGRCLRQITVPLFRLPLRRSLQGSPMPPSRIDLVRASVGSSSRVSDMASAERSGDPIIVPPVAPPLSLRYSTLDRPRSVATMAPTAISASDSTFTRSDAFNRSRGTPLAIRTFNNRHLPPFLPTFPTWVHG